MTATALPHATGCPAPLRAVGDERGPTSLQEAIRQGLANLRANGGLGDGTAAEVLALARRVARCTGEDDPTPPRWRPAGATWSRGGVPLVLRRPAG